MATQDPIDELFKQQAEAYQPQPSLRSWRRIERRIERRRRPGLQQLGWVRAVAALLLLSMAAVAIWQLDNNNATNALAQQASAVQEVLPPEVEAAPASLVNYAPINEGDVEKDLIARYVPNPQFRAAKAYRVDRNI
ncbi:MAG: hypothetical protein AAF433_01195 [Bacteroidota bacterium]